MYDLNILLPVSANGKYYQRVKDFQKYGLLNIEEYNIHIDLLVGTENPELFKDGWDVPVTIISSKYDHCASKIYDYYANITADKIALARWHMRLDDDSITDVEGLMYWIDSQFEYTKEFHFGTTFCAGSPKVYADLLIEDDMGFLLPRGLGKNNWPEGLVDFIPHEWEASVTSRAAMFTIFYRMGSEWSRDYMRKCAALEDGFGDIALSVVARGNSIILSEIEVMTQLPEVDKFSLFGGAFFHIHDVAHDKGKVWDKFIKKYKDKYGTK